MTWNELAEEIHHFTEVERRQEIRLVTYHGDHGHAIRSASLCRCPDDQHAGPWYPRPSDLPAVPKGEPYLS